MAIMLAPLMINVIDGRFSWLCNIFLKSFQVWGNFVQQRQGSFTKDVARKRSFRGKHMKD